MPSVIATARTEFHRRMLQERVLATRRGVINIADRDNDGSRRVSELLAASMADQVSLPLQETAAEDDAGSSFEGLVRDYLDTCLGALPSEARPWTIRLGGSVTDYAQYAHLAEIKRLTAEHPELQVFLGSDYLIRPDIVVMRHPVGDPAFGEGVMDATDGVAKSTFLRVDNARTSGGRPILHASVSCKWTLRSDRAQNARTEALNLIRNRKGRVPAITVVTAEPMPSRLASLADGTGDVDRVYHFALYQLQAAIDHAVAEKPRLGHWKTDLDRMTGGLRLADISDLPFDLLM